MPVRLASAAAMADWIYTGVRREPYVIAIDGHNAAGKSTLSRTIAAAVVRCQVVEGDDFYRVLAPNVRAALTAAEGIDQYFDWQRLGEVLASVIAGQAARYQAYDWKRNALGPWKAVVPEGLILVEGVYSARPALAGYYDAIIVAEAPRELRWQRQQARGDDPAWIERWEAAEMAYVHGSGLAARAQVVFAAGAAW
jgi:uridine kinase